MGQIYPLHEEVVQRYCGYPVGVIMNDGTRHVGILSACGNGKVLLNASTGEAEAFLNQVHPPQKVVSNKKKGGKGKQEAQHKSSKPQAQTQAYPYDPYNYGPRYYNPWGGSIALDFALIAFLFLLL